VTRQTTLAEYVTRMKPEQDEIYFIAGENRAVLEKSPHLEGLRSRGYEVLLLDDTVDEFVFERLREVDGKKLRSIAQGDVELGTEAERAATEETRKARESQDADFLARIAGVLEADVREVRVSSRLTESPACLIGEEHDLSPHLERLLRQAQPESAMPVRKRVLEVNVDHPVLQRMRARFEANRDDVRLDSDARLLHGQALLAEGSPLPDPAAFGRLVAELMAT
jgi:molecular chaperone HtpG